MGQMGALVGFDERPAVVHSWHLLEPCRVPAASFNPEFFVAARCCACRYNEQYLESMPFSEGWQKDIRMPAKGGGDGRRR